MKHLDQNVKDMLQARKGKWRHIAQTAGVSESWVSQFMRGIIPNPGIETLRKLHRAMKEGKAS